MGDCIKAKKKYIMAIFILIIFCVFLYLVNNKENRKHEKKIAVRKSNKYIEEIIVNTYQENDHKSIELNPNVLIDKIGLGEKKISEEQESFSIVIIDSGVYPREEFADKLILSKDFVNEKQLPYDDSGHGTAVAGIISNLSSANIISLKVLNYKNVANIDDVILAFQWVIDNQDTFQIKVINMSIGVKPNKKTSKLQELCTLVQSKGIMIVTSSGNKDGKNEMFFPADYKDVIAVGSVGINESEENFISSFSMSWINNSGELKPDIYAFGENIVTCDSDCFYKGNPEEKLNEISTYGIESGTSFSSAVASGVICRFIQENPDADEAEIRSMLLNGERIYDANYSSYVPLIKY